MTPFAPAIALAFAEITFPPSHAADAAQQAGDVDVVETRHDAFARMTVPVRIGEAGPFPFVIDTGAQNTVVSTALAERLALRPAGRATVVGVAGTQSVATVEIDEIGLGRRTFNGLIAPLLDQRDLGADGMIGLDSLQDQRVLIDFTTNLIAIDEARNLGGNRGFEIVVRARRRSGQLILTHARLDGVAVDVVIDTGADSTIGNRALQRALAHKGAPLGGELYSVTGQRLAAQVGLAERLSFGGVHLNNVAIAYADAPPFAVLGLDRKPAILLGMRELRGFRRVAIDFKTRKVLFDLPEPPPG